MEISFFQTRLEQDKDGTWWYVHVPKSVRDQFKHHEKRGIIHVTVTIGNTTWDGSMLPWADGSAQITISQKVRTNERLKLGSKLAVTVQPRP